MSECFLCDREIEGRPVNYWVTDDGYNAFLSACFECADKYGNGMEDLADMYVKHDLRPGDHIVEVETARNSDYYHKYVVLGIDHGFLMLELIGTTRRIPYRYVGADWIGKMVLEAK